MTTFGRCCCFTDLYLKCFIVDFGEWEGSGGTSSPLPSGVWLEALLVLLSVSQSNVVLATVLCDFGIRIKTVQQKLLWLLQVCLNSALLFKSFVRTLSVWVSHISWWLGADLCACYQSDWNESLWIEQSRRCLYVSWDQFSSQMVLCCYAHYKVLVTFCFPFDKVNFEVVIYISLYFIES